MLGLDDDHSFDDDDHALPSWSLFEVNRPNVAVLGSETGENVAEALYYVRQLRPMAIHDAIDRSSHEQEIRLSSSTAVLKSNGARESVEVFEQQAVSRHALNRRHTRTRGRTERAYGRAAPQPPQKSNLQPPEGKRRSGGELSSVGITSGT